MDGPVRRFSASYLAHTREGMWSDGREALADCSLGDRDRALDVGCGTGAFTRVLAEETPQDATVIGVDADIGLLDVASDRYDPGDGSAPCRPQYVAGDATRLPVGDDAVDLAACQALLINLPSPAAAVRELVRASSDLVAAIEPNNAAVAVASTVDRETTLEREARAAYLEGVGTDVALGDRVETLFEAAGLVDVRSRRYLHEKRTAPPYDDRSLESAARKASGAGLDAHREELCGALSAAAYDDLRRRWRAMGREVVAGMRDRDYERVELVPFEVTVGRVR